MLIRKSSIFILFISIFFSCGNKIDDNVYMQISLEKFTDTVTYKANDIIISISSDTEAMSSLFTNVASLIIKVENVSSDSTLTFQVDDIEFGQVPSSDIVISENLTVGDSIDNDNDGQIDSYNQVYSYKITQLRGLTSDGVECFANAEETDAFAFVVNASDQTSESQTYEIKIDRNTANNTSCGV